MSIINQNGRNYRPIDLETRFHSVKRLLESKWKIKKVCSYYHVKKSSVYRWICLYDGTKESLFDKSHRPKSKHPNALPDETVERVLNLRRRNPNDSAIEIYVRMVYDNYKISMSSVQRILKRHDLQINYKPNKKKHNQKYNTPKMIGQKWQVDVKYVPEECKSLKLPGWHRFYQYTVLDECSRKRFLYFIDTHTISDTVDALKKAFLFFGYYPKEIQTDNGIEFTEPMMKKEQTGETLLSEFLKPFKINHHRIRPRTPQHNGKVERSHRVDQDKFYKYVKFYSLDDLRKQGAAWNKRYNNLPKYILNCKTPNEIELAKLKELRETTGQVRCEYGLTSFDW